MSTPPVLHVIHGSPTAEELALLTAVVAAASGGDPNKRPAARRGGWNDPAAMHRTQSYPGPNGWRAAARPN